MGTKLFKLVSLLPISSWNFQQSKKRTYLDMLFHADIITIVSGVFNRHVSLLCTTNSPFIHSVMKKCASEIMTYAFHLRNFPMAGLVADFSPHILYVSVLEDRPTCRVVHLYIYGTHDRHATSFTHTHTHIRTYTNHVSTRRACQRL